MIIQIVLYTNRFHDDLPPRLRRSLDFSRTGGAKGPREKTMLTIRDLSVLGYANGFTLWHFTTNDPTDELQAPGYFNEAADMLRPGDLIVVNIQNPSSGVTSLFLSVTRIDCGHVMLGILGEPTAAG